MPRLILETAMTECVSHFSAMPIGGFLKTGTTILNREMILFTPLEALIAFEFIFCIFYLFRSFIPASNGARFILGLFDPETFGGVTAQYSWQYSTKVELPHYNPIKIKVIY
jgi:hypothetical protein